VGATRPGYEAVTAFVVKSDPKKRVFLTELFFNTPAYSLKHQAVAQGFDAPVHFRAANLIHELSHQVLDTQDIAYLDAMAPYPDLLNMSTAVDIKVHRDLALRQRYRLSHRSERGDLFTLFEAGHRRDIAPGEGRGYETVLRLTGADTLNEARDIFLSDERKRSQVMLSNADSLTLLILKLGRFNYRVPDLP
jgi:hypothetical protein